MCSNCSANMLVGLPFPMCPKDATAKMVWAISIFGLSALFERTTEMALHCIHHPPNYNWVNAMDSLLLQANEKKKAFELRLSNR